MMGEIGGRGMGYLFENMEKMDIQAERRNEKRRELMKQKKRICVYSRKFCTCKRNLPDYRKKSNLGDLYSSLLISF